MSVISIVFMFAVVIASTTAGAVFQASDNNAVFFGNPNVPVKFNKSAEGKEFELPEAAGAVCCTLGRCVDTCWAYGFRPTFTAQCISCNTCRCVQY